MIKEKLKQYRVRVTETIIGETTYLIDATSAEDAEDRVLTDGTYVDRREIETIDNDVQQAELLENHSE